MITGHVDIVVDDAEPVVRVFRNGHEPSVRVDLSSLKSMPTGVSFHGTFNEMREWLGNFALRIAEAERAHYGGSEVESGTVYEFGARL